MTIQQMMDEMKISALSESWAMIYEEAVQGWENKILHLCDEKILKGIMDEYRLFADDRAEILAAAKEITKHKEIALLTCLIDKALESPETYAAGETDFPLGSDLVHRFYPLIPLIHRIPDIARRYRERGIPEEIVQYALKEYEGCMQIFKIHNGYTGFDKRYYHWTMLIMKTALFHIGRLNFEVKVFPHSIRAFQHRDGRLIALADGLRLHKSGQVLGSMGCDEEEGAFDAVITETEDAYIGYPADETGRIQKKSISLPKDEWKLRLKQGDDVISVHIPRYGALTKEACDGSYEAAWDILRKAFPERDFKAFVCTSWMMERKLQKMLKPTSNIVSFQNRFLPYPCKANGRGVFSFVFQFPVETDLKNLDYQMLPEDTSLRREVKKLYLSGGAIHENGGFFFMD